LIVGFGVALLVLSAVFVGWAHQMYAIGFSSGSKMVALAALPGLVIAGVGALLDWVAARRSISN
jgi:hypothetical protein